MSRNLERKKPLRAGRSAAAEADERLRAHAEIREAFVRLDERLAAAIASFDANQGGPVADRFRGLVVSSVECGQLLARGPDTPLVAIGKAALAPLWPREAGSTARRLESMFGLSQFDLDALLVSLACEFDLRYERIFGYLQDDVTRKRPTVDLVLGLLCDGCESRLRGRSHFEADAPLVAQHLVQLRQDVQAAAAPMLAQYVCADAQIVHLLLGTAGLDGRLAACATFETMPETTFCEVFAAESTVARLASLMAMEPVQGAWLYGPAGNDAVKAARAMACAAGLNLLLVDAGRILDDAAERTLALACREAGYRTALLCIDRADHLADAPILISRVAGIIRRPACPVVFVATRDVPAEFLGLLLPIELPVPEADQRERCWHAAMARHKTLADAQSLQTLAARFRLAPLQIAAAVGDALLRHGPRPTLAQWQSAARAQSGQALSTVADKVAPKACWDDIVLPADCALQLRELCNRVEQHERVFQDWGFARKLSRGRGTAALFSGGSGTGKTMAAEVIANALGLDLYRIDLARVVNKYIGETEKNLDRVFDAAQSANAILFFDEADALFGKRCEVRDAHDRYANIEVSYLLQKMEEYDGLAILASNLADNLDEAFTRRLAFAIHFPFPDEAARLEIWRRAWPSDARLAADLDLHAFAHQFKLSGANIASVALAACFAAATGQAVQRVHVVQALRREFEKLSRPWPSSAAALGGPAIPLRGRAP